MKQNRHILRLIIFLIATNLMLLVSYADAQAPVSKSTVIEQYNGASYYLHTVQPKQTLYSISKAYSIAINRIEEANPDVKNGLRINQVLRIPAGAAITSQPRKNTTTSSVATNANNETEEFLPDIVKDYETIYHVAGRNETFKYIADIYLVPVNNIRMANPGMQEPLPEGEYILVPIAPKEKRPPVINEQRFQRSDFDPFNPTATQNKSSTPQTSTPTTVQVTELPLTEQKTPTRSQASQDDSRQPKMVEPFTVPESNTSTQPQPAESPKAEGNQYVVKPGETLFSLSRKHQLSMDELVAANPGIANGVRAGQILLIPDKTDQTEKASQNSANSDTTLVHIVKKGETLYRISRNYAISINEMKTLNPGLTNNIQPGQQIVLPKKKITEPFVVFEIENSQRTRRLARDFDVDADEIFRLNPEIGRRVYEGQTIKIPLLSHVEVAPLQPEPVETPEEIVIEDPEPEPASPFETTDCFRRNDYSGFEFKVALLLPLYLEYTDTLLYQYHYQTDPEIIKNEKPFSFLSFYKGFMLAADSLVRSQGMRLVIKVIDVDQSSDKAYTAINDPFLKQAHLIVGPLFSKAFEIVSPFALRHQIPIVNPFAKRNEIVFNNPAVIKIKPSAKEQYEQLVELIKRNYSRSNIYLYQAHQYTQTQEIYELRDMIYNAVPQQITVSAQDILKVIKTRSKKMELENNTLIPSITIEGKTFYTAELEANPFDTLMLPNRIKSLIYATDSVRNFASDASVVRENLVIVLTEDNVFATEIVNKLNQVADTFSLTLVGLPEWKQFNQLFNENLMKMKAIYFASNHIDYSSYFTQLFIHQYRKRYASEPDNYAFEAFDIGWYFLNALKYLGPRPMPCLSQFQVPLLQTSFFFKSSSPKNGFENTFWNIYQHKHYRREMLPNIYFLNLSDHL